MGFQMSFQIDCTKWPIITVVAFIWLFSCVSFQMCIQVARVFAFKSTLVAFFRFFLTVYFQMHPQIANKVWGILTLATCVHNIHCVAKYVVCSLTALIQLDLQKKKQLQMKAKVVFVFFRSTKEVANWASGGHSHLTDFKKSQHLGFSEARSEASGDAWDGFGWQESCLYWSLLMFGSVWDCLMLIWDGLGQHICHRPANRPFCLDPI